MEGNGSRWSDLFMVTTVIEPREIHTQGLQDLNLWQDGADVSRGEEIEAREVPSMG